MAASGVVGAAIPTLIRRLRRNPSVAAGPAVLAIADVIRLLVYFRVAAVLLTPR
jgi:Mg/Co/Ni transporter MgtE